MITAQVQVNGVGSWTDRTDHIQRNGFSRMEIMSREANSLRFTVQSPAGSPKPWVPAVNDKIRIFDNDGTTRLFAGTIVDLTRSIEGLLVTFTVVCKDLQHEFDSKTVLLSFSNKTVNYIVGQIVTGYAPTFTTTGVDCPEVIDAIKFNDLKPSECLNKLVDMLGDYVWYIDYSGDIQFFKKYTRAAPFSLGQSDLSHHGNTLSIRRNIEQLRNAIIVRGGTVAGSTFTEQKTADGVQRVFFIGYQLDNITVKLAGVTQTLGTDGVDDPLSKQVLYNSKSGLIKFTAVPAAAAVVEYSGNPIYQVKIYYEDPASVVKYGRREFRIVDESIKSSTAAKQRARAELKKYAERVNEGTFVTLQQGLKVGHELRINIPVLGIDEYFTVSRITSSLQTASQLRHEVVLVASEILNSIDILTKLLINDPADRVQSDGEVLIEAMYWTEEVIVDDNFTATERPSASPDFAEAVLVTDAFSVNPWGDVTYGPDFVIGNYTPSGPSDRKRNGLWGASARVSRNLARNSFFYEAPPVSVPTTTTAKWIDGTAAGGAASKYGWYFARGGAGSGTATAEIQPRQLVVNVPTSPAYVEVKGLAVSYNTSAAEGFAMSPSTLYRLRAKIKTVLAGAGTNGAHVQLLMADGAGTNTQQVTVGNVVSTQDWTEYMVEFTTGATIARGHLECRLYGHTGTATLTGTAYFKEVIIEPVL